MQPSYDGAQTLTGVVGFFDDPHSLVQATRKVREENYEIFDTFTPYPIHGLEKAQGLKRSKLPYVTFGAGLTGFACAVMLQGWTSVIDWPLNVGGKPFWSWPAFVPIFFELTVLFAGLSTVAAMFIFNRLPNVTRKSFDPSLTRDRFAIFIGAPKAIAADADEEEEALRTPSRFKSFSESDAQALLKKVGAKEVRSVHAEGWF